MSALAFWFVEPKSNVFLRFIQSTVEKDRAGALYVQTELDCVHDRLITRIEAITNLEDETFGGPGRSTETFSGK